jgi:FtsP/CotA-like multicopper oxidase with cupredoxin domain
MTVAATFDMKSQQVVGLEQRPRSDHGQGAAQDGRKADRHDDPRNRKALTARGGPHGRQEERRGPDVLDDTRKQAHCGRAAEAGEKVRLRVIAGSASTFFYLQFAAGPLRVIAADGQLVQPFDEERLLVGVAETYDVIVTVPAEGSYEFRATAHDGSGHASLWIGTGPRHAAPDIPFPNLYVTMGSLTLKRVLALTPGGSMGMPGRAVRSGEFDQPGMNGMGDMKKMDHSGMTGSVPEHTGHDMGDMARDTMAMHAAPRRPPHPGAHGSDCWPRT